MAIASVVSYTRWVCWENDICSKYSDVVGSVATLAADVFYLLGEAWSKFPRVISNMAFMSLNFTGLLYFPMSVRMLQKSKEDLVFAWRVANKLIFVSTLLKVLTTSTGIILTTTYSVAAIAKMLNYVSLMRSLFTIIRPCGTSIAVCNIVLDGLEYLNNRTAVNLFKEKMSDRKIMLLSNSLLDKEPLGEKAVYRQAAIIRQCMDKDTWKVFRDNLDRADGNISEQRRLFEKISLENLKTQKIFSTWTIALRVIGYVGMVVACWYPGTVIQASIWTGMAFLHTVTLLSKKFQEAHQRSMVPSNV